MNAQHPITDPALVRSHIEMLHELATASGVDGVLVCCGYGENPKTRVKIKGRAACFAIGDVDGMVDYALGLCADLHRNVYAPWAVLRRGLATGTRGKKEDIRAVLALVVDADADHGKAGIPKLPMLAPYTVRSSADNLQPVYPLAHALPPAEAQPIAEALAAFVGGDGGTKDIDHVWRIPGTLNWPNAEKLRRGRPETPQLVTVAAPWDGTMIDGPLLLKACGGARMKAPLGSGFRIDTGGEIPTEDEQRAKLKNWLRQMHTDGEKHFGVRDFSASMAARGVPQFVTEEIARAVCTNYDDHAQETVSGRYEKYYRSAGGAEGQSPNEPGEASIEPVDLWGVIDPPALPPCLLPPVIDTFARTLSMTTGGDPAGFAGACIAVAAGAISDEIALQPKEHDDGWRESARLWVALCGDPSTMKSPTINAAVRPLAAIDARLFRAWQAEIRQWDLEPKGERGPPPAQRRAMLGDTTVEAAQGALAGSPGGVLLKADELSGWFASMERYAGRTGNSDRAFWLQAWNGGTYAVNRVGRGASLVENLSVSLVGGIQPEPVRAIAGAAADDGLIQRLLPIVLRPAALGRDVPMPDVASGWAATVERLHAMEQPLAVGFPVPLRFDPQAQAIWREMEARHHKLTAGLSCVNRKLAAFAGKLNGTLARLVVVWQCVEARGDRPAPIVPASVVERAGGFLHRFLVPHAVAFYASLGLADDHETLADVAGYILAHGKERVSARDIERGSRRMQGLDAFQTSRVFEQLEALGWVRPTTARRRDSSVWVVNPVVRVRFADRAKQERSRREAARDLMAGLVQK
jgi:hypothetical protein